jgi:hypothetical protein
VDSPQSSPNCDSVNVANAAVPGMWEGIRIFDISNPAAPQHITSVATDSYTGGTTVADLTDPANPVELAFYKVAGPPASNAWSSYWHNGFVYANDIVRGFDVFSPLTS